MDPARSQQRAVKEANDEERTQTEKEQESEAINRTVPAGAFASRSTHFSEDATAAGSTQGNASEEYSCSAR